MTGKLQKAWEQRGKLFAERDTLYAESDKLLADGNNRRSEGDKRRAESEMLYAEGLKKQVEGRLIFINAVIEEHGNDIEIRWTDDGCEVAGRAFKHDWHEKTE